jgi:allantoate deiminase
MRDVHRLLREWMERIGMRVSVDAVGNLRGVYGSGVRLLIGSHLDTVPHAGAFDGVLGVVLAIALVEALEGRQLKFGIEVVGFSEEEGVRFGVPFIGSRALVGSVDGELLNRRDAGGTRVLEAIREFGLDPGQVQAAAMTGNEFGYLEFHIEQGPVLESLEKSLGVVEAIAGQSRLMLVFEGKANHAGTTPIHLRHDALAGAAEWIACVEQGAQGAAGLMATVGRLEVEPGAENVVPGLVRASLDVRHANDTVRATALRHILSDASRIAEKRGLTVRWEQHLDQPATAMSPRLTKILEEAAASAGYPAQPMVSGAGHDAMVLARKLETAMLFLRSPGGISHHPDESVLAEDVAAALAVGLQFLERCEVCYA